MISLTCPKCRQGLPDEALDAGQCPLCGFPLDGPVVLGASGHRGKNWILLAAIGALVVVVGVGFAVFTHSAGTSTGTPAPEVAAEPEPETRPAPRGRPVAPFPHEPTRPDAANPVKPPTDPPGMGDKGQPLVPPDPVRPDGPRPIGVRIPVNPKIEPKRHFDQPDDTVAVSDLNSGDRVTLTGRVRILQLGSVNGKGSLDASGLVAEEVVITGDLNAEAVVLVNAPRGKVTLRGLVAGSSKLTIRAPEGEVTLEESGSFTGGSTVTITAKQLETKGLLTGGTKVNVTFNPRGMLKIARASEGAIITYMKAAPTDPAPGIHTGEIRGGVKVLAGN